jgi:uroporphyrin-III C-methyltransferase
MNTRHNRHITLSRISTYQHGRIVTALTLLLSLISVLGVAYLWVINGMPIERINKEFLTQAQSQGVVNYRDTIKDVDTKVVALQEQQGATQNKLKGLLLLNGEQDKKIKVLEGTDQNSWKIAEVKYLIKLALHRAYIIKDIDGAVNLLKAGDLAAKSIEDQGLFSVREAIAKDVIALKAIKRVDQQGIFAQLSALSSQVESLPVFKAPEIKKQENDSDVKTASSDNIAQDMDQIEAETTESFAQKVQDASTQSLTTLWKRLGINYHDNFKATPMLTAEQHRVFIQNVRLLLEQAKIGMLTQQQEVFISSIKSSYELLEIHGQKVSGLEAILDDLAQLQQKQVTVSAPQNLLSLTAFNQYMKNVNQSLNATRQQ